MKILCIGHITYDITFPIDKFPLENSKNRYYEKEECVGGPASIAALLLGRWNQDVQICGVVGNDDYGRRIKKEFALNGVRTNTLSLKEDAETSKGVVLANRVNGTRTTLIYSPKNDRLEQIELNEKPDIILIDGYEPKVSMDLLKKYPSAISVIDAGRNKPEVVNLARMVKYLVCSLEFAESVTGMKVNFQDKKTLVEIYSKMESIFHNTIVITLEANGCLYKINNQIKIMPSIKVKTIDSTGAGDIFHGAFVYGLVNNFDLEKNIKFSNIAGALSVTRVGGYKSIPNLEEMMEVYNAVK